MITFILYEYILFQYINYTSIFLFLAYSLFAYLQPIILSSIKLRRGLTKTNISNHNYELWIMNFEL